jgi:hypothetical protein
MEEQTMTRKMGIMKSLKIGHDHDDVGGLCLNGMMIMDDGSRTPVSVEWCTAGLILDKALAYENTDFAHLKHAVVWYTEERINNQLVTIIGPCDSFYGMGGVTRLADGTVIE